MRQRNDIVDVSEAHPDFEQFADSAVIVAEAQENQTRFHESRSANCNNIKVHKLRSGINNVGFLISQFEEQIRLKTTILDTKRKNLSKINSSNARISSRVETIKGKFESLAGHHYESILDFAKNYETSR
jgi:hypothetical protein